MNPGPRGLAMLRNLSLLAAGLGISAAAAFSLIPKSSAEPAPQENRPPAAPAAEKSTVAARQAEPAKAEVQAAITQLPIGQVVLFSSGVGYFQREGQVE